MRRFPALILTAGLVACGGGDQTADAPEAEGMDVGIELADVAGAWNVSGTLATEEPTVIEYTIVATDSEYGWVLNLPGRDPIDIRIIAVEGDSIIGEAGPFESILQDGLMVTTRTVTRLVDGMLVGTMMATYDTEPAQMMPGTFEGTRAME